MNLIEMYGRQPSSRNIPAIIQKRLVTPPRDGFLRIFLHRLSFSSTVSKTVQTSHGSTILSLNSSATSSSKYLPLSSFIRQTVPSNSFEQLSLYSPIPRRRIVPPFSLQIPVTVSRPVVTLSFRTRAFLTISSPTSSTTSQDTLKLQRDLITQPAYFHPCTLHFPRSLVSN